MSQSACVALSPRAVSPVRSPTILRVSAGPFVTPPSARAAWSTSPVVEPATPPRISALAARRCVVASLAPAAASCWVASLDRFGSPVTQAANHASEDEVAQPEVVRLDADLLPPPLERSPVGGEAAQSAAAGAEPRRALLASSALRRPPPLVSSTPPRSRSSSDTVSLEESPASRLKKVVRLPPEERSTPSAMPQKIVPVTLHIYDVAGGTQMKVLNRVMGMWGSGAFHAGIEVYGREFSFFNEEGVASCVPMECEGHAYAESVLMGYTAATKEQVCELLMSLKPDWQGNMYNILSKNCCHFSDEFCRRLTGATLPSRVKSLAAFGNAVVTKTEGLVMAMGQEKANARRFVEGITGNFITGGSVSQAPPVVGQGVFHRWHSTRATTVASGQENRGADLDDEEDDDFTRGVVATRSQPNTPLPSPTFKMGNRPTSLSMCSLDSRISREDSEDFMAVLQSVRGKAILKL